MDPHDEPDTAPRGAGLRDRLSGLLASARGWAEQSRSTSFVPAAETVVIDARRHSSLLVGPGLRTLAGLAVVVAGSGLLLLLVFVLTVGAWAQGRLRSGGREKAFVVAGTALALVVLPYAFGPVLPAALLLLWLAEDVTDWHSDRLVVTDKRIYRRHGVLTTHSPSISLMAVAYLDAAVPPLGRLLHYGTLQLDSAAQDDAPLSRFDLIPDVVGVSQEILRLRAAAMPRYPQQPL